MGKRRSGTDKQNTVVDCFYSLGEWGMQLKLPERPEVGPVVCRRHSIGLEAHRGKTRLSAVVDEHQNLE